MINNIKIKPTNEEIAILLHSKINQCFNFIGNNCNILVDGNGAISESSKMLFRPETNPNKIGYFLVDDIVLEYTRIQKCRFDYPLHETVVFGINGAFWRQFSHNYKKSFIDFISRLSTNTKKRINRICFDYQTNDFYSVRRFFRTLTTTFDIYREMQTSVYMKHNLPYYTKASEILKLNTSLSKHRTTFIDIVRKVDEVGKRNNMFDILFSTDNSSYDKYQITKIFGKHFYNRYLIEQSRNKK